MYGHNHLNTEYEPYTDTVYGPNTTSHVQHIYIFEKLSETLFINWHIESQY